VIIVTTAYIKVFSVFASRCSVAAFNGGRSPSSEFPNCPRLQLPPSHFSQLQLSTDSTVEVKVTLQLTGNHSVSLGVEPHLGLMTRYLLLCGSYGLVFCVAPSLTRGQVCLLYILLGLPKAVFLGSKSLGDRDHILLSQI
jgi:hypothetical protein